MNEVGRVRRAAALMRQRAQAAAPAPWWPPGAGGPGLEHIVSWHPQVAVVVADWLEAAAHREQELADMAARRGWDTPPPEAGDEIHAALAVAHAYLAGGER